jgi:hypothetical protein
MQHQHANSETPEIMMNATRNAASGIQYIRYCRALQQQKIIAER